DQPPSRHRGTRNGIMARLPLHNRQRISRRRSGKIPPHYGGRRLFEPALALYGALLASRFADGAIDFPYSRFAINLSILHGKELESKTRENERAQGCAHFFGEENDRPWDHRIDRRLQVC